VATKSLPVVSSAYTALPGCVLIVMALCPGHLATAQPVASLLVRRNMEKWLGRHHLLRQHSHQVPHRERQFHNRRPARDISQAANLLKPKLIGCPAQWNMVGRANNQAPPRSQTPHPECGAVHNHPGGSQKQWSLSSLSPVSAF